MWERLELDDWLHDPQGFGGFNGSLECNCVSIRDLFLLGFTARLFFCIFLAQYIYFFSMWRQIKLNNCGFKSTVRFENVSQSKQNIFLFLVKNDHIRSIFRGGISHLYFCLTLQNKMEVAEIKNKKINKKKHAWTTRIRGKSSVSENPPKFGVNLFDASLDAVAASQKNHLFLWELFLWLFCSSCCDQCNWTAALNAETAWCRAPCCGC